MHTKKQRIKFPQYFVFILLLSLSVCQHLLSAHNMSSFFFKVLDLSFNMLTSLHHLTYLSLRHIEVAVGLDGNKWQCDCTMRSVWRSMVSDGSSGLHGWKVMCATPSELSGKELVQLKDDDLQCLDVTGPRLRPQELTVSSGSEILFSCAAQGNDTKYINSVQIEYRCFFKLLQEKMSNTAIISHDTVWS